MGEVDEGAVRIASCVLARLSDFEAARARSQYYGQHCNGDTDGNDDNKTDKESRYCHYY